MSSRQTLNEIHAELRRCGIDSATAEKFVRWLSSHKEIWIAFERYALQAKNSGREIGAKAVAERVRWEAEVEHIGGGEFKLSNTWVTYLGRLFNLRHGPYFIEHELKGVRCEA